MVNDNLGQKKGNYGVQLDDITYRFLRLERAARVSGDPHTNDPLPRPSLSSRV
jgi:hypothetical protein